ncbi:MAG TPA: hypothetical protein VHU13_04360, partial [Solirubrobacteraceae bacterium]|nr:hypothetical protein [Solirubrobacteraceae bacterium]
MRRLLGGRRVVWAGAALLCVIAGVVASLLGAHAVAHRDGDRQREAFRASANGIASELRLTLQRDGDLAAGASTFFAANPYATRHEFRRWSTWAAAGRSFPELDRLALVGLAPAQPTGVAARRPFAAQTSGTQASSAQSATGSASSSATAPNAPLASQSSTAVRPPAGVGAGARLVSIGGGSYYCYTVGETGPGRNSGANRDCVLTPTLLITRDSGRTRYRTSAVGGAPALVFDTPVYRGNATPVSLVGRRAAFVGWLREVLLPQLMLQQSLRGYPDQALRLRYRTASTSLPFASGTPRAGGQSAAVNLHGGWTARVFGAP